MEHKGLLIVIEGTDGSGKSTQIELLKRWIEDKSYGCMVSEWKTSRLIAHVIDEAKDKNLLNATTFSLLYAADFANRLENTIIPALNAGFVVLLDRYTYTAFARDVVRGLDIEWVEKLYNYAPKPDLVFYLDMPIDVLLKRVIGTTGLDYWESGRDIGLSSDFYKSFKIYQDSCLKEYNKMKKKYNFVSIDGTEMIYDIHEQIITNVEKLLQSGKLD
jgi:dTMP kinase